MEQNLVELNQEALVPIAETGGRFAQMQDTPTEEKMAWWSPVVAWEHSWSTSIYRTIEA
jgi:hypothetical protein